jgi:hypothetical protein
MRQIMKNMIKGTDERVSEIESVFQETLLRSPYDVWLILDIDIRNLLDPSKHTVGETSDPTASTSLLPIRSAFPFRPIPDDLRSAGKIEALLASSVASRSMSGNHSFSAALLGECETCCMKQELSQLRSFIGILRLIPPSRTFLRYRCI